MPRIPHSAFRQAHSISPHIATLLGICRDLRSAANELRWITQHVLGTSYHAPSLTPTPLQTTRISELVHMRAKGMPLQYILGSQPFGPLDILCWRGVLIPRPETEAYTTYLAGLIVAEFEFCQDRELRLLDICSGSGCIALGLYALLGPTFSKLRVEGIDISPDAISLARRNILHNSLTPSNSQHLAFTQADIFAPQTLPLIKEQRPHIMISNPPYVDPATWTRGKGSIGRSVRRFEPELALVAPDHAPLRNSGVGWERADAFYGRLAEMVGVVRPEAALWEVGDEEQALRVLRIAKDMRLERQYRVGIWRDWPDMRAEEGQRDGLEWMLPTRGSGKVRSIFLRKHH